MNERVSLHQKFAELCCKHPVTLLSFERFKTQNKSLIKICLQATYRLIELHRYFEWLVIKIN